MIEKLQSVHILYDLLAYAFISFSFVYNKMSKSGLWDSGDYEVLPTTRGSADLLIVL